MNEGSQRRAIVAAILLATFLAAMEATVVATALPTAVAELGGLDLYGWVGAIYMLATTVSIPLFGKLSDTIGRKPVLLWGIVIFLVGSLASGLAPSMVILVVARAVQGIGAGAVTPVSMTIVGDLYTPAQRARIQALFGAIWGIAGMSGPLVGGLIVKVLSWRWVFYINLPFGVLSCLILSAAYRAVPAKRERKPLDALGSFLLAASILLLLLGATGIRPFITIPLAVIALVAFMRVERTHPDPVLPLGLITRRLIAVSSIQSAAIGALMTGTTLFVPLFVQAVLQGSPTQGGMAVAPMLIGWPLAAAASSRLILRIGTRAMVLAGAVAMAIGGIGIDFAIAQASGPWMLRALTFVMGVGMGLSNTALVISVQHKVRFDERGVATAALILFRSLGGAVAAGAMGALFAWAVAGRVPHELLDDLLGPDRGRSIDPAALHRISQVLAEGVRVSFHLIAATGFATAATSVLFPQTDVSGNAANAASEAGPG